MEPLRPEQASAGTRSRCRGYRLGHLLLAVAGASPAQVRVTRSHLALCHTCVSEVASAEWADPAGARTES